MRSLAKLAFVLLALVPLSAADWRDQGIIDVDQSKPANVTLIRYFAWEIGEPSR
jgi:hypothetical protein